MQSGWFALSAIRSGWSGIRKLNPRRNCAVVAQAHVCVANPSKWMSSLDYSPQVGQCLAQTPDALNLGQNRLRSVEWPRNGVEAPAMRCVRHVGARVGDALFTPACSSPPSIALRPCVAARSSMSGASSRAAKGKHETLIYPRGQCDSAVYDPSGRPKLSGTNLCVSHFHGTTFPRINRSRPAHRPTSGCAVTQDLDLVGRLDE
jgi:hypothetical protein